MGKKALLSGVREKGSDRIEFDFEFNGVRYRPTLERTPTEANLRRAYKQLQDIKERIARGVFSFEEDFPDYRFKTALPEKGARKAETCDDIFDKFLAHCEMRVKMDDMAFSTLDGYREILDTVFRPKIGQEVFEKVVYSELAKIVSDHTKNRKKKTYNNVTSAVRTTFKFGYKDRPGLFNPALALQTFRITAKDRPRIDPFTIQEAETIIAAAHRIHGEWYGNYEEFRFFTGLRQSEEFALKLCDCDLENGVISINKAVVLSRAKNRTKTNLDREITLCPRARKVLERQLGLRKQMVATGKIKHDSVFFVEGGEPFETLYLPYNRWREVMEALPIRYRKPYNSRHSYISWRLMVGHNRLLVALEDGHSVATMERTYAAWTKGAKPEDVELIKVAMTGCTSTLASDSVEEIKTPPQSPAAVTTLSLDEQIEGTASATASARGSASDCSCKRKLRKPCSKKWLGWQDSNLRMAGSKPAALPLGDTPAVSHSHRADQPRIRSIACNGE